ncbi:fatty acid desaturase family protein (plasmid) [Rhizobium leguminosarum]
MSVQRHRFSKEILRAVRSRSRSDNWHGPLEALEHWSVIAASIWVSSRVWENFPVLLALPIYLLAIFLIGGRQRALAGLLHQACHGTLMSNKKAGQIVGSLFGGYPVLQSYSGYRASHVYAHHGNLGHPERDPDYLQYRRYGLCGSGCVRETLRRHLRAIFSPRSTASYIDYLARNRIWNCEEHPWEGSLRIVLLIGVLALAATTGTLGLLAAFWLIPLISTHVWIGMIAELLEHYPLIDSKPAIDIHMSWNRSPGLLERILLGEKKGEGFHLVHHLFPQVPLWRLEEVHEILRLDPTYRALDQLGGSLPALSRILAALPARAATTGPALTKEMT